MVLYYLFMFSVALFVAKGIYNIFRALSMRAALYIRLNKICKAKGFKIQKMRHFLAPFFRYSNKPDITLSTPDTDYLLRIITCRARKRTYHFVNHEWYVRAFKLYLLVPFMSSESLVLSKHAGHLPPLDEKFLHPDGRKKQVVLLFNPSPTDITFNSSNRREIGSNGTDFDGWLIYNGKAFAQLLNSM